MPFSLSVSHDDHILRAAVEWKVVFKFTDIFISDGIKLFDWRIFIRDRARQPIRRMVEIGLKAKERAMRANSPIEGCATVNNTDPLFTWYPWAK